MKGSPVGLTVKLMTIPEPPDPGPDKIEDLRALVLGLEDGAELADMLGLAS